MPPVTRQDQRLSLRAGNPSGAPSTDLALQQILDEFDNYKRMMSAQNRDIIKTNVFGQARIRHLEEQVTALEEKITLQASARTKVEARALQLEHQLACIQIAFDFLSNAMPTARSGPPTMSDAARMMDRVSSVQMPAPPARAKSNVIKLDQSMLSAGIMRPIARAPALALGRVQEERSASPDRTSPKAEPAPTFPSHVAGVTVDHHGVLLYPPLPSPTCTDTSGAPSPVRTPDLDFPLTLPLNITSSSTSGLSGLNIRIESSGSAEADLFQPHRLGSRPNLIRSDTASWSLNSSSQSTPELTQRPLPDTHNAVGTMASSSADSQSEADRVTVRRRMQGRTSSLMPAASKPGSGSGTRSSIVGPTSPWSLTSVQDKGKERQIDNAEPEVVRVVLSDTSNTFVPSRSTASQALMKKSSRGSDHVDTPTLRTTFDLPSKDGVAVSGSSQDRYATVPSARKRGNAAEATKLQRVRTRSEDSCSCDSRPCRCGTPARTPSDFEEGSTPGSAGTEAESETPRGQHVTLPLQIGRSRDTTMQVQETSRALAAATNGSSEAEAASVSHKNDDEGGTSDQQDTIGRPSRRARSSVNYALPKLNTKMRKPDGDSNGPSASSTSSSVRSQTSSRTSTTSATSTASRRISAQATLRAAVAAQGKRMSAPSDGSSNSDRQTEGPSHQRVRSRSSSSDVSIMSLSSGSSATPTVRTPALGIAVEPEEGTSTRATPASSLARTEQETSGSQNSARADGDADRSTGSSTIIAPRSSSSNDRSDSDAGSGQHSLERISRRSSATVSYALPKLNTKMRKPDPESLSSEDGSKKTAQREVSRKKLDKEKRVEEVKTTPASGQPHSEQNEGSSDDEDDHPGTNAADHDSAGVSANIAHYSTRTLRKSVIPNYALPKLNTKIRKPDPAGIQPSRSASTVSSSTRSSSDAGAKDSTLATNPNAESPKRKAARRAVSSENLFAVGSSSSSTTSSLRIRPKKSSAPPLASVYSSKALGRAAASSALSSSGMRNNATGSGSAPDLTPPPVLSPRTSLHAMLTTTGPHLHPARERSGSSTSSASTVRGMPGSGGMSHPETQAIERGEGEGQDDDSRREESDDDETDDEGSEGEDGDSSYGPSSPAEMSRGANAANEDEDEVGGDHDGTPTFAPESSFPGYYDDRMDPVRFSDPPGVPSSPPGLEVVSQVRRPMGSKDRRGVGHSGRTDGESEAAEDAADSTMGGSVVAVGSSSLTSNRSESGYGSD
ncbi:hypothetical protein V8E36_006348 [Tilletia maclaganii]